MVLKRTAGKVAQAEALLQVQNIKLVHGATSKKALVAFIHHCHFQQAENERRMTSQGSEDASVVQKNGRASIPVTLLMRLALRLMPVKSLTVNLKKCMDLRPRHHRSRGPPWLGCPTRLVSKNSEAYGYELLSDGVVDTLK